MQLRGIHRPAAHGRNLTHRGHPGRRMAVSWSKCPVPGRLREFWGEIPPLFGGPGRDKTARSAGSVPELSNTTVGGWQTPCSGDPDRTASPCRRSRFQNSPVRSATVVTATDLAQGNLKAERGRPAISSLVGDRHGHMDCRKMPGRSWIRLERRQVVALAHRSPSVSGQISRSVATLGPEG